MDVPNALSTLPSTAAVAAKPSRPNSVDGQTERKCIMQVVSSRSIIIALESGKWVKTLY